MIVECSAASAEDLPDIDEVIEARESDEEVFITLAGMDLPTPEQFISHCASLGVEVAWRTYGGEARPASEVPRDDYDGWMLQRPRVISDHPGGMMVTIVRRQPSPRLGMRQFSSRADPPLWAAILSAFEAFGIAEADCGNRHLGPEEFADLVRRNMEKAPR